MKVMRVLVCGAGAVGLGLASFLSSGGVQVVLLCRSGARSKLESEGLTRTGQLGYMHISGGTFSVISDLSLLPYQDYTYVLICTKANDVAIVISEIQKHKFIREAKTPIGLFVNGWGCHELVAQALPGNPVLAGAILTGFERANGNSVHVTVHGAPMRIGTIDPSQNASSQDLCDTLARAGFPTLGSDDICRDLWAKLIYNAAVSPLGALLTLPSGELVERESRRLVIDAIVTEAFSVMHASGHTTYWRLASEYLEHFYGTLLPSTSHHFASLTRDLVAGRPTEIDWINGAIVRLAARHGIACPVNWLMLQLIKSAELLSGDRYMRLTMAAPHLLPSTSTAA